MNLSLKQLRKLAERLPYACLRKVCLSEGFKDDDFDVSTNGKPVEKHADLMRWHWRKIGLWTDEAKESCRRQGRHHTDEGDSKPGDLPVTEVIYCIPVDGRRLPHDQLPESLAETGLQFPEGVAISKAEPVGQS